MGEYKYKKILAVLFAAALLLACTDTVSAQAGRRTGSGQYAGGYYFEDIPDDDSSFWEDDFWEDRYEDIPDDIQDDFREDDYEDTVDDAQDDFWEDDYEDTVDDAQDDFWEDDYEDTVDDAQDDFWEDDYEDTADDAQDDFWEDDYEDEADDNQDDSWDDIGEKKPSKKNSVLSVPSKNCKVKVISAAIGNPTVSFYRAVKKNTSVITVPEKVTVNKVTYKVVGIADNAFSGNKKVNKVVVGKNVAKIGKKAFFNCKNLKQITFRTVSISSVGKDALKNTGQNLVIKVPKAKLAKYKKLFSGKGNKKINIKRSNN